MQSDDSPYGLDDPKWPGAGKEPVCARRRTAEGEGEDECAVPTLKRVHDHHEGDGAGSEGGKHKLDRL